MALLISSGAVGSSASFDFSNFYASSFFLSIEIFEATLSLYSLRSFSDFFFNAACASSYLLFSRAALASAYAFTLAASSLRFSRF